MPTTNDAASRPRATNPYARLYEDFRAETASHVLTVLEDNGLSRRVRVATPGTGYWGWTLYTFQDYLGTVGDIADGFIFSRLEDMITFFDRSGAKNDYYTDGSPYIDFRYWAEKLRGRSGDVREYSSEVFLRLVTDRLEEHHDYGIEAENRHQRSERVAEDVCRRNGVDFEVFLDSIRFLGRSSPYLNLEIDPQNADEVEFFGEPIAETSPAVERALLIQGAKMSSGSEEGARSWLESNREVFGDDTYWESDLRDFSAPFVLCCYAIDLTVQLWRAYERSPEAIALRAARADSVAISDDALRMAVEYAERGLSSELGAVDARNAYTVDEMVRLKARFEDGRRGIQALQHLQNARRESGANTDQQA